MVPEVGLMERGPRVLSLPSEYWEGGITPAVKGCEKHWLFMVVWVCVWGGSTLGRAGIERTGNTW